MNTNKLKDSTEKQKAMKYKELKQWFVDWLEWQTEPVPLNVEKYLISTDIRIKININLELIEEILKTEGKATTYARTLLNQLNQIRVAIENESHDIRGCGWTVLDKWIENKK